jgi:hypothetical protein
VRLAGGARIHVDGDVDGPAAVGLYPWDVEVRSGPGPEGALSGVVTSAVVEGGRVRVRVGAWAGEALDADGLVPGALAHGIVHRSHLLTN